MQRRMGYFLVDFCFLFLGFLFYFPWKRPGHTCLSLSQPFSQIYIYKRSTSGDKRLLQSSFLPFHFSTRHIFFSSSSSSSFSQFRVVCCRGGGGGGAGTCRTIFLFFSSSSTDRNWAISLEHFASIFSFDFDIPDIRNISLNFDFPFFK